MSDLITPEEAQAFMGTGGLRVSTELGGVRALDVPNIDVRALCRRLCLRPNEFADRYGLPYVTVRRWIAEPERQRSASSALLLALIEAHPYTVSELVLKIKGQSGEG